MRDIRSDLQERFNAAVNEARAIAVEYEKRIEQLQSERDAKIEKAKMKVELLSKLIEFENEAMSKVPSETPPAGPPQRASLGPAAGRERRPNPLAQGLGFKKMG
jgi:hypothetical protein